MNTFYVEQFYLFFQGILIFQIVFFGLICIYSRKREITYYTLFLFATSTYFFINAPKTFFNIDEDVIFNAPWYISVNLSFLILSNVFYLLFIGYIFNHLYLSRIIKYLIEFSTFLLFLSFFLPFFHVSTQVIFYLSHLIVLPVSIFVFFNKEIKSELSILFLKAGVLLNVIGTVVTLIMIVRYNTGIRKYFFDGYPLLWIRIGILAEILFFQVAILRNWIHQEKELVAKDLKAKLQIAKIREEISSDLHDEIGSGLTKVSLLAHIAQNKGKNDEYKSVFEKISTEVSSLLYNLKDIVWSVEKDFTSDFLKERLSNYIADCKSLHPVNFIYENKMTRMDLLNNMEINHNIYLIIKEAVNNSIKYSKASQIAINLNDAQLIIEDNGIGLPDESNSSGHGIKNIYKRSEKSNAQCIISSDTDQGVKIVVTFPKEQNNDY